MNTSDRLAKALLRVQAMSPTFRDVDIILGEITGSAEFRERCRDLGLLIRDTDGEARIEHARLSGEILFVKHRPSEPAESRKVEDLKTTHTSYVALSREFSVYLNARDQVAVIRATEWAKKGHLTSFTNSTAPAMMPTPRPTTKENFFMASLYLADVLQAVESFWACPGALIVNTRLSKS